MLNILNGRNPAGRGGGRASAALPLLDDVTASPASRRLASARPALAPKCHLVFARTLSRKPQSSLVAGLFFSILLCRHAPAKEFLTPKEIEKIQDAQQIDERVKVYLEAAALRLKAVEERLNGKESAEGDPLEFFTVEEMLDGYYRCLKSVMLNFDDAAQNPKTNPEQMKKALTNLHISTDRSAKDLGVLKKMAEEKRLEQAWNLVRQALDITLGAREGAELGLSRYPDEKGKPRKP